MNSTVITTMGNFVQSTWERRDGMSDPQPEELDQVVERFVAQLRRGERPTPQEYAERHPELAGEILELFPTLVVMEHAAPASESNGAPLAELGSSDSTGPAASAYPETLGDYRLVREIGRGGMGVVYEAEQKSLGRRVALKVLASHAVAKPVQRQRFEREARAAARLHHTNIVPVFGVGEADGTHFYIMQYIPGLALNDVLEEVRRLKEEGLAPGEVVSIGGSNAVSAESAARSMIAGRFEALPVGDSESASESDATEIPAARSPETEAQSLKLTGRGVSDGTHASAPRSVSLPGPAAEESADRSPSNYRASVARIGVQVAEALDYAHSQGVVHRDIKPANLLLDLSGTVWITDFGLASLEGQDNLTRSGDILGTLRYMPPEALSGRADERGDIYSLGLTLYELLAMRPAIDAPDRNQTVKRVSDATHDSLNSIDSGIPADLQTIVHKAISREARDRYRTARELADDLNRFLNDEPILARRVSPTERLVRWSRRNPVVATLTGLVAALLLTVAVITTVAWSRTSSLLGLAESRREAAESARGRAEGAEAVAREAAARARESEQQAVAALDREEDLRRNAEILAEREAAARRDVEVSLYANRILLASSEWESNNVREAARLLAQCPTELRGWEWRYLSRLINSGPEATRVPGIRNHARMALSGDRRRLALAGNPVASGTSGHGVIVDLTTREVTREITGLQSRDPQVDFHPTEPIVAVSMQERRNGRPTYHVALINIETGNVVANLPSQRYGINHVSFSPDGTRVAAMTDTPERVPVKLRDGRTVNIRKRATIVWNAADGTEACRQLGPTNWNQATVRWSPDGQRLAVVDCGERPRILDAGTGEELAVLQDARIRNITDIRFSPSGSRVVLSDQLGLIATFDGSSGQRQLVINTGQSKVWSVVFSPDRKDHCIGHRRPIRQTLGRRNGRTHGPLPHDVRPDQCCVPRRPPCRDGRAKRNASGLGHGPRPRTARVSEGGPAWLHR